jgi:hypothetical protein
MPAEVVSRRFRSFRLYHWETQEVIDEARTGP